MAQFTNPARGARGINMKDGTTRFVEPGQTVDLNDADVARVHPDLAEGDAPSEPGPLDGSVEDLEKHLEGVDDPDEVQRLIDAETAGKSRKGALTALESRRDALLDA